MITPERIQELRELCEKATPEPWCRDRGCNVCNQDGEDIACAIDDRDQCSSVWARSHEEAGENLAFIAASRTAIPLLLDEVERLQNQRKLLIALIHEKDAQIQELSAVEAKQ